jgi:hypothetical protein
MRNLTLIQPEWNIADSLKIINANYEILDEWTQAISLSASNYWQPLSDLYNFRKNEWNQSISLVTQNSAAWIDMSTLVESNSAKWVKPLVIYYPGLFSAEQNQGASSILSSVSEWLNKNYPVTTEYREKPFYIQDQTAIVYNYFYYNEKNISVREHLLDQTLCSTEDGYIKVTCATNYIGYVFCSNGDFQCTGRSSYCMKEQDVECYYNGRPIGPYNIFDGFIEKSVPQPPIVSTDPDTGDTKITAVPDKIISISGEDSQYAYSTIEAYINVSYTDRRESTTINAIKFKVKDCKWVYDGLIGPVKTNIATTNLQRDSLLYNAPAKPIIAPELYSGHYLTPGSDMTFKIPEGASRIKLIVCGSPDKGSNIMPDQPIGQNNVWGWTWQDYLKKDIPIATGGEVYLDGNFLKGRNGNSQINGIGLGGDGKAAGGGAFALKKGYASGGKGCNWISTEWQVRPGSTLRYTTGVPYKDSKIEKYLTVAGNIDDSNTYTNATYSGSVTQPASNKGENTLFKNAPDPTANGTGGMGWDIEGNPVPYGGYIYIQYIGISYS